MTIVTELGKGTENSRTILKRTGVNPPEYRIQLSSPNFGDSSVERVYSTQKSDGHLVLTRHTPGGDRENEGLDILGVAHTNEEADGKLATIAKSEFQRQIEESRHPSKELIEFIKKYGGGKPHKQVFVNEVD